jgi:hypothetical protein
MRINLSILSILLTFIGFTQSNEIGIIPFKIEKNSETLNNHFEPKFLTGLYYQHSFKRFHWLVAAEYGENSIDDGCNSCADHLYGTGILEELNLHLGFGAQWYIPIKSGVFQPSVRLKASGMATNYLIRYEGGFSGAGGYSDRRHYFIGGAFETGVAYYHSSNFVFKLDYSLRMGSAWSKKGYPTVNDPYIRRNWGGIVALQLSVGYSF